MTCFTAEGFQTGSLQVSVGGQNQDTGARRDRGGEEAPAVRRVESARGFSSHIPTAQDAGQGDLLVNLFI